jgi:branched-chain amino acid transport system substrate-binding protein
MSGKPMLVAAAACALALAASGCGGSKSGSSTSDSSSGGSNNASAGSVKVGLSGALSGSVAFLGQDSQHGAELAISELEKQNPKIKYSLTTADDQCSPAGGASAYRKLTDVNNVDVILGSPCSGSTLGGMPVLKSSRVPGVTFGATNPTISQQSGVGGNTYSWRMNIDDSIMGEAWSKFIADHGVKKVALLVANNDFGRGAAEIYKKSLPANGVTIVSTDYYTYGGNDFRPELTKIANQKPDAIVALPEPPECALILKQMKEIGLSLPVYSRGGCATDEALKALGSQRSLANGVFEGSYWVGTPQQAQFTKAFQQRYQQYPPYNAALAYYGMMTLAKAVAAGGPSREGIESGLAKVNYSSPIGPIKFDAHHQAHPNMFILTVRNGKIAVLKTIKTS